MKARALLSGVGTLALLAGVAMTHDMDAQAATVNLEPVAEGLTHPVDMQRAPDGRLYVLEQPGRIRVMENGEMRDEPFLDITDKVIDLDDEFDERGLLGIAFHPEYEENGRFFVYYSAEMREDAELGTRMYLNHTAYLAEYHRGDDGNADPDSEMRLMTIDQPAFNHNGGQVLFGPDDGYLYLSLGDGGTANDMAPNAPEHGYGQERDTWLGKILRLDVSEEGEYSVPDDNPFVDDDEYRPEIYTLGWRNPWRMSFDKETGELYATDVGQDAFESMNHVQAGGNHGWRILEGTHCFDPHNPREFPEDRECADENWGLPLLEPVIEYKNLNTFPDEGRGISITGGYMYRGEEIEDLQGMYVFGDWSRSFTEPDGVLMYAEPNEDGLWEIHDIEVGNMDEPLPFFLAFGQDGDGELYVMTTRTHGPRTEDDVIYKIVPAD